MKIATYFLFIILSLNTLRSQTLNQKDQVAVKKFIAYIKHNRVDLIASEMSFPFRREYPIPEVKDSADFVHRFVHIFDKELIKTLSKSSVIKEWAHVGWRGIMFLDGVVWLDEDGRLIAVNHRTKYEADLRQQLIDTEKMSLHLTIQDYFEPVCILKTEKYRVRIDKLKNQDYRYTSWNKKAEIGSKPDLILTDGKVAFDGSGGNHKYTFISGEYRYEIDVSVMGESNSPDAILSVFKGDKEILTQPGTLTGD